MTKNIKMQSKWAQKEQRCGQLSQMCRRGHWGDKMHFWGGKNTKICRKWLILVFFLLTGGKWRFRAFDGGGGGECLSCSPWCRRCILMSMKLANPCSSLLSKLEQWGKITSINLAFFLVVGGHSSNSFWHIFFLHFVVLC